MPHCVMHLSKFSDSIHPRILHLKIFEPFFVLSKLLSLSLSLSKASNGFFIDQGRLRRN